MSSVARWYIALVVASGTVILLLAQMFLGKPPQFLHCYALLCRLYARFAFLDDQYNPPNFAFLLSP